ncbi:collagen alpha-2(XI) chain-like isoform X2 [Haliotis rubra]|uniref:collagen alpha-2(XI) chain-like isoform X2 n=1 Tax=Haliotis rubra TaxID=36100 RepID=UPI001EE5FE98|nr:collagen alpha-2(XI) chain-like isoform X2 [Haliotis rubra]
MATGPAGDGSERTLGYYDGAQGRSGPVYYFGKRVNFSNPEDLKLIKKQVTMHCCEDGATGMTGSTGVTGSRGAAGYTGLTGLSGNKGDNGMPGATGTSGQDGLRGATGPDGAIGDVGPPGVPGMTGLTGQRGPTGITGVSGSHGSTGPVGPAAVTGRTGSTGPVGETGVSGMPGLTGTRGDAGATGVTGLKGESGATGPKGELFKYPDKCKMTPSPCEQICVNIGISHECRCREGYTLAADNSSCVDVDECATGGPCEQLCQNTVGSFRCSCRPGFNLTANQRNCEDFDECEHNVCPYPSYRVARICKNTIGSFICIGFGTFLSDLGKEQDNTLHYDFQSEFPPPETPATLRNLVRTTNVLTILVGCLLGVVLIIVIGVILLAYKTRKSYSRSPSVYRLHPEMYGSRGNLSPRSDAECGVGHERTYVQQPYPGMTL